MSATGRVAVTSRSFSRHPVLREELLKRYPDAVFNETGRALTGAELIDFLKGHEKAITALDRLDDATFAALPDLKIVAKYGVGLDMIDLAAMSRRGIRLGWTGGVNKRSVSELVIAATISLLRHLPTATREVENGIWRQPMGGHLSGRTVGIVGCGHIGKDLVVLLKAFGCALLAHDIRDFPAFYARHGVIATGLDDLLGRADVVTLHLPLDDSTRGIIDARRLGLMRKDAVLINAARGGLVDEAALKAALIGGRLAGAAVDAFASEPPDDMELLRLPNFLATPHIGGSAEEAVLAMGRAAIDGLDAAGDPLEVAKE